MRGDRARRRIRELESKAYHEAQHQIHRDHLHRQEVWDLQQEIRDLQARVETLTAERDAAREALRRAAADTEKGTQ